MSKRGDKYQAKGRRNKCCIYSCIKCYPLVDLLALPTTLPCLPSEVGCCKPWITNVLFLPTKKLSMCSTNIWSYPIQEPIFQTTSTARYFIRNVSNRDGAYNWANL